MPSSQTTAFVVMSGDTPIAVATELDVAQDNAFTRQARWAGASEWNYRWDEHIPGSVWRLMQRRKDRGGRYSWTTYSVHAVDSISGGAR
jgi:hypothetical protein